MVSSLQGQTSLRAKGKRALHTQRISLRRTLKSLAEKTRSLSNLKDDVTSFEDVVHVDGESVLDELNGDVCDIRKKRKRTMKKTTREAVADALDSVYLAMKAITSATTEEESPEMKKRRRIFETIAEIDKIGGEDFSEERKRLIDAYRSSLEKSIGELTTS